MNLIDEIRVEQALSIVHLFATSVENSALMTSKMALKQIMSHSIHDIFTVTYYIRPT